MPKISIARRRLEVNNRQELPDLSQRQYERRHSFSLVGRDPTARSIDQQADDRALAFPIPDSDARLIESLAPHISRLDQPINATLHREGAVLVLRIQPPAVAKKLISCEQVSEMLGVSRSSVYRLVRNGKLPTYRIGRALRFDPSDVFAFLTMCLRDQRGISCT
ncbi:MAG: helix-turn-helix domain-containing protein [Acidobacteriota bacterium]